MLQTFYSQCYNENYDSKKEIVHFKRWLTVFVVVISQLWVWLNINASLTKAISEHIPLINSLEGSKLFILRNRNTQSNLRALKLYGDYVGLTTGNYDMLITGFESLLSSIVSGGNILVAWNPVTTTSGLDSAKTQNPVVYASQLKLSPELLKSPFHSGQRAT